MAVLVAGVEIAPLDDPLSVNKLSDHARVAVTIDLVEERAGEQRVEVPLPPLRPVLPPLPGQLQLDDLLQRVMNTALSHDDALRCLYGSVDPGLLESDQIYVYTDGSCCDPNTAAAKAGSGVCWGLGAEHNSSHRTPGRQTSPRAEIFAVFCALSAATSTRGLDVWTDSETAIRTFCHWAPSMAEAGWICANADLIAATVILLAERTAITRFHWVKGHSGNPLNDEADRLAADGCDLPLQPAPALPDALPKLNLDELRLGVRGVKVRTDLPRVPMPGDAPDRAVLQALLLDDCAEENTADAVSGSHRGRTALRSQAAKNLAELEAVQNEPLFWVFVFHASHPRSVMAAIACYALTNVFGVRMNAPLLLPPEFTDDAVDAARTAAAAISEITSDTTEGQHFSRRFTLEDVAVLKARIQSKQLGKARGADRKSYRDLLHIPNEVLCELFNACLEVRNVPGLWLTTILVGILKRKLDPLQAESYRTVGLECCLLKMFMMLMDARTREWVEAEGLLPPSQNGFRAGFRTNNNTFILRCAAERARAQGRVLYMASVDISNAFPSVDHDTLWVKLRKLGMGGPLFDVYRLVYARMLYYVRVNGETGEGFAADMGVLIGDPASPIMWLLYFRDLNVVATPDDVKLAGVAISHLEQADDIVIFALSPTALQAKLDSFYEWCSSVFLLINKLKSWWMPLGCLPRFTPSFTIGGEWVPLKDKEFYVGMKMSPTKNIFEGHAQYKADTAFTIASILFASIDKRAIQCPPTTSCKLYKAVIDPHLTHGSDVSPDATKTATAPLERTQELYLRKALRVGKKTVTVALFTETGIWPVRYRRADLLVRFLGYLMQRPAEDLVSFAFRDSKALAATGKHSWYSDVGKALRALPIPVLLPDLVDSAQIDDLRSAIVESMRDHLQDGIDSATKLDLLRGRPRFNVHGLADWGAAPVLALRPYLKTRVPDHRTSLTRLLLSSHALAVERLRWTNVPRAERLCRFCESAVEDAIHVLFECDEDATLLGLRDGLTEKLRVLDANLVSSLDDMDAEQAIKFMSTNSVLLPVFARYVHYVLRRVDEVDIYRP